MSFVVRREGKQRANVIVVSGEADVSAADPLQRTLDAVAAEGHRRVIIDLSEVELLDSRTMGVLGRSSERLRADGGGVSIACSNEKVLHVLRLIGLEHLFEVFPTLPEAEAAASAEARS